MAIKTQLLATSCYTELCYNEFKLKYLPVLAWGRWEIFMGNILKNFDFISSINSKVSYTQFQNWALILYAVDIKSLIVIYRTFLAISLITYSNHFQVSPERCPFWPVARSCGTIISDSIDNVWVMDGDWLLRHHEQTVITPNQLRKR